VPPDRSGPNTLQGVLTSLFFLYDGAQNPRHIIDVAGGAEWPSGAVPTSKILTYDDAYRLREVKIQHGGPNDDDLFVSPLAAEEQRGDTLLPRIGGAPNRVRHESFVYDWLGNTTLADDDAHLFDRSPGTITNGGQHRTQIASATQGGTTAVPAYDVAGNMTRIEITHNPPCSVLCPARYEYFWDETGNLATARRWDALGSQIRPIVTLTYAYEGGGARVLKSAKNETTRLSTHTAEVFNTLRLEGAAFSDGDGDYEQTARTERVYLATPAGMLGRVQHVANDVPSGTTGRTRVLLEMGDHLGSTSFVIDKETSELVERTTYASFGATESDYRPVRWASFRESYRYTGKADDAEVGLAYFGARYYLPALGRWLSADPLTVANLTGDMNPYAFVRGSPMRLIDPLGLCDTEQSCSPPPSCDDCSSGGSGAGGGSQGGSGAGNSGNPLSGGFEGGGGQSRQPIPLPPPKALEQGGAATSSATTDDNGDHGSVCIIGSCGDRLGGVGGAVIGGIALAYLGPMFLMDRVPEYALYSRVAPTVAAAGATLKAAQNYGYLEPVEEAAVAEAQLMANSVRGGAFENVGRQAIFPNFPQFLKNNAAVFGKLVKGEGWKSSVPDWLTSWGYGRFQGYGISGIHKTASGTSQCSNDVWYSVERYIQRPE
jgi:RHS repeat-associated protein